jgi:Na+-driven multidrug efflux pump
LAVHVALANTASFFYFIGLGVNITLTTFVGVSVGQNKKNDAIKYSVVGTVLLLVIVIIEEYLLWKYQENWATLFGADEDLQALLL